MSNDLLKETYAKAVALNLSEEFIRLIEVEIRHRGIAIPMKRSS
ncbi:MAG: sporulation histidine kinase inhibitor Sda [Bacilli bacterium]